MRRLPSSFNAHNISDIEIDEVFSEWLHPNVEIPLQPRDHGERILYVGINSSRMALVEIGVEDQGGELVIFHAREATKNSIKTYEELIKWKI